MKNPEISDVVELHEMPESATVEAVPPEISTAELEVYVTAHEERISNEVNHVATDSEARVESQREAMKMSPDLFREARNDFGLDEKLEKVEREAKHTAEETIDALNGVMKEVADSRSLELQEAGNPKDAPTLLESAGDELAASIQEDQRVKQIRTELVEDWKRLTGKDILSGDGQDFLFGDPTAFVRGEKPISVDQRATQMFKEAFPEDAQKYAEHEKRKVYDRLGDDPTYRFLNEEITKRTNLDSQVMAASRSGNDYSNTWYRINARETRVGLRQFAESNPEKAEGYAQKWRDYVTAHPQVEKMNNYQWDEWCKTHKEGYGLGEYRDISAAIDSLQQQKLNDERVQERAAYFPSAVQENLSQTTKDEIKRISTIFEKAKVGSRALTIEGNGDFPEALVFEKKEVPREKLIRIFRGVNYLDDTLTEQTPYAMRKEGGGGNLVTLEEVRNEVEALAQDPTYENLLAYTEKVRNFLSEDEITRLEEDIAGIEEDILKGVSTRQSLLYKQIAHSGGLGQSGITPYISASYSPYDAIGYGGKALMVLDVPVSEIEDLSTKGSEVGIKGSLDKKYITAIIPRQVQGYTEYTTDETNRHLHQALIKVYAETSTSILNPDELSTLRHARSVEVVVLDRKQWEVDVARVREKRVKNLMKMFPEIDIDMNTIKSKSKEEVVDIYTGLRRYIFDQYKNMFETHSDKAGDITEYEFAALPYGERKKFSREDVSDDMLVKLREFVQRMIQRKNERNRRNTNQ